MSEAAARVRSLRKKLRQVTMLQDAQDSGVVLSADQRQKLQSKSALLAQLEEAENALVEHQASTGEHSDRLVSDVLKKKVQSPEAARLESDQSPSPAEAASGAAACTNPSPRTPSQSFDMWYHGLYHQRELDLHFDAVCALWWDGDVLLTGSWDTSVKLCDLSAPADQEVVRSWGGHVGKVRAVNLLREQSLVVSGSSDCSIRLWSLLHGMVSRLYVYTPLLGLDVRGPRAMTALHDGTVKLWDLESGREEQLVGKHTDKVTSVQWHEHYLAFSTSSGHSATLWDIRQKDAAVINLPTPSALLTGRAETGSSMLIAADDEGEVRVWDVRVSATPLAVIPPHADGWVARGVDLSGSTAMACGSRDEGRAGFLSILDLSAGTVTMSVLADAPALGAVSTSGNRALVGCRDGRVFVYDALRESDLDHLLNLETFNQAAVIVAKKQQGKTSPNEDGHFKLRKVVESPNAQPCGRNTAPGVTRKTRRFSMSSLCFAMSCGALALALLLMGHPQQTTVPAAPPLDTTDDFI